MVLTWQQQQQHPAHLVILAARAPALAKLAVPSADPGDAKKVIDLGALEIKPSALTPDNIAKLLEFVYSDDVAVAALVAK